MSGIKWESQRSGRGERGNHSSFLSLQARNEERERDSKNAADFSAPLAHIPTTPLIEQRYGSKEFVSAAAAPCNTASLWALKNWRRTVQRNLNRPSSFIPRNHFPGSPPAEKFYTFSAPFKARNCVFLLFIPGPWASVGPPLKRDFFCQRKRGEKRNFFLSRRDMPF